MKIPQEFFPPLLIVHYQLLIANQGYVGVLSTNGPLKGSQ
jgi:hypothetical protein